MCFYYLIQNKRVELFFKNLNSTSFIFLWILVFVSLVSIAYIWLALVRKSLYYGKSRYAIQSVLSNTLYDFTLSQSKLLFNLVFEFQ